MDITGYERQGRAAVLMVKRDDGSVMAHIIPDGCIEAREAVYGTGVDALELILIEAHILPGGEDMPADPAEAKALVQMHRAKLKWIGVNAVDIKANMRLPRLKAELVKRVALNPVSNSSVDTFDEDMTEAQAAIAQGYERMYEERKADEFVSGMPAEQRRSPRSEMPDTGGVSVGLAIEYIP